MNQENLEVSERSARWYNVLAVILLTATFLNYANRATFTQTAAEIKRDFNLDNQRYGTVEAGFGYAFAVGALFFGFVSDFVSVRWLYVLVVVVWSLAGLSTGVVTTYNGLLISRVVLGFFEAGHWSCSWRTVQRLFGPELRTRANSVLQSGASVGAILTPLLVTSLVDPAETGGWRIVFWVVGLMGLPWVLAWLGMVAEKDLRGPVLQTSDAGAATQFQEVAWYNVFFSRRFLCLFATVMCINLCWHYIRVWMPLTLVEDRGYSADAMNYFTSAYYLSTFVGCLASGWLTAYLVARGWHPHRSRMFTFALCSLMTAVAAPIAYTLSGPVFLTGLMVVAFGSLGLFPIYYSLTQEMSAKHQGKVAGTLAFSTWIALGIVHTLVGAALDYNPGIRPVIFASVGLAPLVATFVLTVFWGKLKA